MISPGQRDLGLDLLRLWKGSWRRTEIPFVGRSMAPLTDRAKGLLLSHGEIEPRIGDILLTLQRGTLIAHRAVRRVYVDGRECWVTQGDSCLEPDPEPTPVDEILGRVVALVEERGTRELTGPFSFWASRWAAFQTRWLGRFLAPHRDERPEAPRPSVARRLGLAVHRLSLRAVFRSAGGLEKCRVGLADWQVHAFRSPLWRLLAATPDDPLPSADLAKTGLREAERYDMDLLVLRRLRMTGRLPQWPQHDHTARRQAAVAFRQVRWKPRLGEVLESLRRLQIPHMAMKGFAQSLTLYRGDASREMGDVDLLVPASREKEARSAVEDLGFRATTGPNDPDFPRHHHEAPQWDAATGLVVEIHREVAPARVLRSGLWEGFWRRADSVDFAGGPLLVPSREDRLLHLCLHLSLHRYLGCLRDLFEVATMLEDESSSWNWRRVREVAEESDCLSTLTLGLRLASLGFRAPIPEEFLQDLVRRLRPRPFREVRIRLLARHLTGPPPEKRGHWIALFRWLCKQLAPL